MTLAAAAVFVVGVVGFFASGEDGGRQVVVVQPAATLSEKQLMVEQQEAARAAALAKLLLHPGKDSGGTKGGIIRNSTPSPTPAPVPYGVSCRSGDLAAKKNGGNGAGGTVLWYIAVVNTSEHGCDLPPISFVKALAPDGSTVFLNPVTKHECKASFCIPETPLPLSPLTWPPVQFEVPKGGATITIAGYLTCTLGGCPRAAVSEIVLGFEEGVVASLLLGDDTTLIEGRSLSVWDVHSHPAR